MKKKYQKSERLLHEMACKCISKNVVRISLWIALPTLAISIVVIVLFPTIFNTVLKRELTLGRDTIATGIWEDIPIPIYEKLYFFNITNKEAFLNGTEPLKVIEVGPYTYKARWVKKHPEWHSNYTVSYREKRTYHFVPDMSNGTEEDVIFSLNGPMIIASNIAKEYNIKLRILLSTLFGILGENIVIQRSIKELAYGGYEDMIIKYAPVLKPNIPYENGIFSWLYGKNATNDGSFTVFTGADDSSKTNFINNWNGAERLPFWKGESCNMMNGTSIETGPPILGYQESYTFFQSIFCRSLTLNYTEDKYHLGILSKRFRTTYSLFANSTENPDNYCFEVGKERPSGILDVSQCQFGAPIFISFPHFYLADPSYLRSVEGLNPNDEQHGSYLDAETVSGFTISTAIRFQFNVELTKVEGILQTYNVTEGILPLLWVELSLQINEEFANVLKSKLNNPKIIAYSVLGTLAGLSFILAIVFLIILCLYKPDDDDDDPLIDAVDNNSTNYCPSGYYDKTSEQTYSNSSEIKSNPIR